MATKVPTKKIRKEIRSLRKGLSAEKKKSGQLKKGIAAVKKRAAKTVRTVTARTSNLSSEMNRLKTNLQELAKKKTPKKQLSEYNLFMRRQLKDGKSFNRAVKLWKAYKRGAPIVRTRAISKTVTRPRAITKIRTVIRRVPVTKMRTIRSGFDRQVLLGEMRDILSEFNSDLGANVQELKKAMRESGARATDENASMSDERVALEILSVFFQEVHRLGLKRRLELSDVVDSYFDTLSKIKGRKELDAQAQATSVSDTLSSHK